MGFLMSPLSLALDTNCDEHFLVYHWSLHVIYGTHSAWSVTFANQNKWSDPSPIHTSCMIQCLSTNSHVTSGYFVTCEKEQKSLRKIRNLCLFSSPCTCHKRFSLFHSILLEGGKKAFFTNTQNFVKAFERHVKSRSLAAPLTAAMPAVGG